jgi:hypothetical protein
VKKKGWKQTVQVDGGWLYIEKLIEDAPTELEFMD